MQHLKQVKFYSVPEITNFKSFCQYIYEHHRDLTAFKFKLKPKGEVLTKTYQDFYEDVQASGLVVFKFLNALKHLSPVAENEVHFPKVALWGSNSYAWRVASMASACNESLVVPLDKLLKYGEFKGLMDRARPEVIFYGGEFHEHIKRLAAETDYLKLAICMNEEKLGKQVDEQDFVQLEDYFNHIDTWFDRTQFVKNANVLQLGYALQSDAALYQAYQSYEKGAQEPSLLLFTSGTTEQSKGIVLSQENVCSNMRSVAEVIKVDRGTVSLSLLPLHHIFENTVGFIMLMYYGCCICDNDGLRYIADNFKEYKPELMMAVPMIYNHFYNRIQQAITKKNLGEKLKRGIKFSNGLRKVGIDLRRKLFKDILEQLGGHLKLGIAGAAPSNIEVLRFFEAIGVQIIEGYGLTETAPVCAGCYQKMFEPGTVGHAFGHIELAIDNQKPGESGEILVRGKNVMLGYWKSDAEFDRHAIDEDGWFHTGDLGQIVGPKQCLKIVGRLKSMIVLESGKKVFPEEVEDLFKQENFVKEVLLWGTVHEDGSIQLALELSLDQEVLKMQLQEAYSEEAVRQKVLALVASINQSMPPYKNIRYVVFNFEDMVKTTTMKIKRRFEQEAIEKALADQGKTLKEVHGQYFSKSGQLFS